MRCKTKRSLTVYFSNKATTKIHILRKLCQKGPLHNIICAGRIFMQYHVGRICSSTASTALRLHVPYPVPIANAQYYFIATFTVYYKLEFTLLFLNVHYLIKVSCNKFLS